jgi:hypothetical protein
MRIQHARLGPNTEIFPSPAQILSPFAGYDSRSPANLSAPAWFRPSTTFRIRQDRWTYCDCTRRTPHFDERWLGMSRSWSRPWRIHSYHPYGEQQHRYGKQRFQFSQKINGESRLRRRIPHFRVLFRLTGLCSWTMIRLPFPLPQLSEVTPQL